MKCTTPDCREHAAWRVSVPLDPWPLQYACERHLPSTVQALGGDCRVVLLVPGTPTPEPRSYFPTEGRNRLRVRQDPAVPREEVRVVDDDGRTLATIPLRAEPATCPSTYGSACCELPDTAAAHRAGRVHRVKVGSRTLRWIVNDDEWDRWGAPANPGDGGGTRV